MRKILKLNIFHLVEKIVRFHGDCRPQIRIAYLLHLSQTCEFRSQPTIAFFAVVNHLNGPLRKQNCTSRVQKVMVCDLWISIRCVCFSVSRFVACDRNAPIIVKPAGGGGEQGMGWGFDCLCCPLGRAFD